MRSLGAKQANCLGSMSIERRERGQKGPFGIKKKSKRKKTEKGAEIASSFGERLCQCCCCWRCGSGLVYSTVRSKGKKKH